MTIGTAKTATIGKVLNVASTEDGSGFYSVDTTAAAFTTTLAQALIVGEQLRFKQAAGSWGTNGWTLTAQSAQLKFVTNAGVTNSGVSTATFSSRSIGEVVAEWDGAFWQVTILQAAIGGVGFGQSMPITTQNTLPALSAPWNGYGVPTLDVGGNEIANGTLATTTSTAASTTAVIAVTSATGISVGQLVTGTGVPSGTTVVSISGLNVTVSQAVNIASGAALTFASAVVFTANSTTVTFTAGAAGFNLNIGDQVTAFYNF